MEGSGRVHTRCSSPRKYSRKPGPHHMRRILRTRLSFPRTFLSNARGASPRKRESSSYCRSVTSLLRHSPPPSPFVQGEGRYRRRRESNSCRPPCTRLLLKHRSDDYKFVHYWKNERLPNSQQSSFRWISSGGDRSPETRSRSLHRRTWKRNCGRYCRCAASNQVSPSLLVSCTFCSLGAQIGWSHQVWIHTWRSVSDQTNHSRIS